MTLTLVHHPQTFLPAFLKSFSHFLLSFSKNPWIPPNSHFLLTGDVFLLFSEKKRGGCFHSGTPTKPINICIPLSCSPILLSPWSPICPPVFGCPLVLNPSPSHLLQQASSLFLQTLQSLFYCLSCIIYTSSSLSLLKKSKRTSPSASYPHHLPANDPTLNLI